MPMTLIHSSRSPEGKTQLRGPTFTGDVWADPILGGNPDISINHIMFTPCARTHWHRHEKGQVLEVKAGSGWICDKGGKPQRLGVGDMVWAPPGTVHWHGADEGSYMMHLAISHGETTWLEEVSEEEYAKKGQ